MTSLANTFKLLANTANEAAAAVLIAALDASQRDVRDLALAAILDRGGQAAELNFLRRWSDLSERCKQQIADRPGWLSSAIRAAIVHREPLLFPSACSAAVFTRDYESIPLLVTVAIGASNPFATQAATATLELAELLTDELASPRDYRTRRDPQILRGHVLVALEKAIDQIGSAHLRALLEAFLLLANRENAALNHLLQSPAEASHKQLVVDVLASSSRPAIEKLLLSYLDDPHAPHTAIEIIAQRGDISFVRQLTRKLASGPTAAEMMNLRRVKAISWLPANVNLLDALREAEQPGAIHLVVESSVPREQAFDVLAYILCHGKVVARRLAVQALATYGGSVADNLAVQLLEDDDSQVRASAARQLRERNVPGAIQRLVDLLDSPHAEEREAAQIGLQEFTFDRFAAVFDGLTPEARLVSGALVRRVDPQAIDRIQCELSAPTRGRKQRAIELALALAAVEAVQGPIAALLKDEDQYLRIDAIRALATQDSRATRDALRDALLDSHPLVHQAAEIALAQLTRGDTAKLTEVSERDTVIWPATVNSPRSIPLSAVPANAVATTIEVLP